MASASGGSVKRNYSFRIDYAHRLITHIRKSYLFAVVRATGDHFLILISASTGLIGEADQSLATHVHADVA